MKGKALIIGVLIPIGIAAAVFIKASGGQQVEVVKATRGVFTLAVEEAGYVQAVNDSQVQAAQAARVVKLLVEPGDSVKAGDVLVRLASPELIAEAASVRSQLSSSEAELHDAELGLELIRAELEQAENDLARRKILLDSGALAQADYEQAELEVTRLRNSLFRQEASIDGLNKQLASLSEMLKSQEEKAGELQVVSPINGTVLDLPVETGQVVLQGTLLAQVGSDNNLEIKTELLSDEVRRVKKGQITRITAPVLGDQILTGKVSKIYPRAYEKTSALGVVQRRVPVIIALEQSSNLQPGYEVRAIDY